MKKIIKVKCPVCNGNKNVVGDGCLTQKCEACEGTGELKACAGDTDTTGNVISCPHCLGCGKIWESTTTDTEALKEIPVNIIVEPRRRGRPKTK